jgi:threonine synthase
MHYQGIIHRYKKYLPVTDTTPIVSLCEGRTPLVEAMNIAKLTGVKGLKVFCKIEGLNPSGSFKDRGMTMAVSKAVEKGAKKIICASTGNTSAAAAAYASRVRSMGYEMESFVIIPAGYVALGKLSQAMIYGSRVVQVRGNFDDALNIVKSLSDNYPIELVNSLNPYRIEGQKTAAFEIVDELGESPDYLCLPVGNAGNITAYWKGFKEYVLEDGKRPHMYGFQAEGASPIVHKRIFDKPETIATAIRIGNPASWEQANNALSESNGHIDSVTDREILDAYKLLHQMDGIACEPSSATGVAGLLKAAKQGLVKENSTVVCILTGNGLKDPSTAIKEVDMDENETYPADAMEIIKVLGLERFSEVL